MGWFWPREKHEPPAPLPVRPIEYRAIHLLGTGALELVILWFCPCGEAVLWDGPSITELPPGADCPVCRQPQRPALDDLYVTMRQPGLPPAE
jgi:hypothetical protein